jgi:hypothetical protein
MRPGAAARSVYPEGRAQRAPNPPGTPAKGRGEGGRLYPAKDARMGGEDFRRAYPAWEQLEALRDPAISSSFWRRVTT